MKKILLSICLAALAGGAWAQNAPTSGISESTDPAKVQEVEKRAQDMQSRQQQSSSGASNADSGKSSSAAKKKHKHKQKKSASKSEKK
jgi:hypothetical protein